MMEGSFLRAAAADEDNKDGAMDFSVSVKTDDLGQGAPGQNPRSS